MVVPDGFDFSLGEIITLVADEPSFGSPITIYLRLRDTAGATNLDDAFASGAFPGSVYLEVAASGYNGLDWGVTAAEGHSSATGEISCGVWLDSDGDGTPDHADPDDDNDELDDPLDPDPLDGDADDDGIPDGEDVEWLEDAIRDVPASSIKSPAEGNRNAMLSILRDVEKLIASGNTSEAVRKLRTPLGKVDGCGTKADKNDWILNCSDQIQVRGLIQELTLNLTT